MISNTLLEELSAPGRIFARSVTLGNRIPKDYFVTTGKGESDITIHAGSYHLALKNAGIEMCNIISYSSILPSIAREVDKVIKLVHGSVMETIMAVSNTTRDERATAAVIYGWLQDRITGTRHGGLVCEYNGNETKEDAGEKLRASLNELYENGYSEQYELADIRLIAESFVPKKNYGTALVALCFVNYVVPILGGAG